MCVSVHVERRMDRRCEDHISLKTSAHKDREPPHYSNRSMNCLSLAHGSKEIFKKKKKKKVVLNFVNEFARKGGYRLL